MGVILRVGVGMGWTEKTLAGVAVAVRALIAPTQCEQAEAGECNDDDPDHGVTMFVWALQPKPVYPDSNRTPEYCLKLPSIKGSPSPWLTVNQSCKNPSCRAPAATCSLSNSI